MAHRGLDELGIVRACTHTNNSTAGSDPAGLGHGHAWASEGGLQRGGGQHLGYLCGLLEMLSRAADVSGAGLASDPDVVAGRP